MCKCLAPNAFSGIDLEKLAAKGEEYQEETEPKKRLDLVTESWWTGDLNALYTCVFLAFAWSEYVSSLNVAETLLVHVIAPISHIL